MVAARGLVSLAVSALCAPALAGTYVVDDDGGVGVDFTDIAPAIAFAAPGDVILVQPGSYIGFALDKGLSVLGASGVSVAGAVLVGNVPLGPRAVVQRMTVRQLAIVDSQAPVLANEIVVLPVGPLAISYSGIVSIRGCDDVRMRAITAVPASEYDVGYHGIEVISSRVEITHSHARGRTSPFVDIGSAGGGYDGLTVSGASNVHVSLSTFEGGTGGGATNGGNPWLGGYGGPGGAGIRAQSGAEVLITGRANDAVRGGRGGYADDCEHDGAPSSGVVNHGGYVRHSGVSVVGALAYSDCGTWGAPAFSGQHDDVLPIDASLQVTGSMSAGTTAVFTLRGVPGDAVRLRLGRQLALVDLVDVYEDRLLVPLRTYDLGTLPASGEATFSFPLPSTLPPGFLIVAQGSCVSTAGVTRLSQSVPIALR